MINYADLFKYAKLATLLGLLLSAVLAAPALAQGIPQSALPGAANNVYQVTPVGILDSVITIAFYILMLLAILFVLWAAFNYLTAGGNPEKVETAQRMIMYAVIAIVIGILARSVPWIISNFVESNVTGPSYQTLPTTCPHGININTGTCN